MCKLAKGDPSVPPGFEAGTSDSDAEDLEKQPPEAQHAKEESPA
jgi:hypothetical protein